MHACVWVCGLESLSIKVYYLAFLYTFQNSTSEDEFSDRGSTTPYIFRKFDADETIPASYSIFVEKELLSVQTLPVCGIFFLELNLSSQTSWLFTFIQEVIFKISEDAQKNSAALSNFMAATAAAVAASGKDWTLCNNIDAWCHSCANYISDWNLFLLAKNHIENDFLCIRKYGMLLPLL